VGSLDVAFGAYGGILINKNFKDIKRLVSYFDWLYSDEAMDILSWGPESDGLWAMKDGKKVFKDQKMVDLLFNGEKEGDKGPYYYGLFSPNAGRPFPNKAVMASPLCMATYVNIKDSRLSYPIKADIFAAAGGVLTRLPGYTFTDTTGKYSGGDNGPNTSEANNYIWGKFFNDRIGKVLSAKTEVDEQKVWKEQYDLFVKEGKYDAAVADMEKWFAVNSIK
jgi:putative aldouronate transport system substrate-binding protein